jgi:NADH dehydrogenase
MLQARPQQPGPTVVITGAFSYTGKYAAEILLQRGYRVRTLTYHPNRPNPFGSAVPAFPFDFEEPEKLCKSLRGAFALVNTYWVRFRHGGSTFDRAFQNTQILINAAREAGVKRIVHVSIANPSLDSPLGYYRGKAELEQAICRSGLSYAILRPTVIFGREDILINNIAWFARHFPVFVVPGNGRYRIQPIFVGDMAQIVAAAVEREDDYVLDAVGPESFTFDELFTLISKAVDREPRLLHLPATVAYVITSLAGLFVRDVVLTWQEYRGLLSGLLASDRDPAGDTLLSKWVHENRSHLGAQYASELARHF